MLEVSRDFRLGLRLMLQRPGFSLLILIMLAAGIGVNAAVFSVVDAFLLRPLPFAAPDRLVKIESVRGDGDAGVSFPDYQDWRERNRRFQDLALIRSDELVNISFGGGTEPAHATLTTANLFPLLGVPPLLGRWLLPEDDRPGAGCVVLLSHGLWTDRLGGDPRILGRRVLVEDRACSVAGVMPAAFGFPSQTEVWSSIAPEIERDNRVLRNFSAIGRLRPGVSLARARQDIAGVAQALAREHPDSNDGVGTRAVPLRDVWVSDIRQPLILLLGACGFLLLMTCANVANLLLARALGREREIAIRTALGADRRRLAQQLTAEHLVLGAGGGILGLGCAYLGVAAVGGAVPVVLPSWLELHMDWTAVGYTACVSVVVALLFGLAPMAQLARTDLTSSLKEAGAAGGDRSRRWLRSSLVVLEIALALALLVGARLMVTTFLRLRQVDPGFRSAGVLVADVNLTYRQGKGSPRGRYAQLIQDALARIGQLPGVESDGADTNLPLTRQQVWDRYVVTLFGQSPEAQTQNPTVSFLRVSPDYFKTLGIGLVRGRFFGAQDVVGQPRVALLGQEAARRLWPHDDPIGRRLKIGPPAAGGEWLTVVGVVRDVRQQSLAGEPGADMFVPIFQAPGQWFSVLVRARGDPRELARSVRVALTATSPDIGVLRTTTLQEVVASSIWVPRLWGWLFAFFSLLALLLAAGGIYGVMASSVRERTREIGIRMALGARRWSVLALMLRHGLKLALTGALLGLSLAAIVTRWLSSLVFGVEAGDPWILVEVASFLIAVALLACWMASRRAAQVDPLIALRYE
ncbi:MAG: ABC transporter permease [Acidobacteria bacterium]|nr:ABC transporter permease [Acidobacteriota bacterium]